MAIAELRGTAMLTMEGFHAESRQAFGFPDTYGNSMDAWIDCMSYLRDEDGMTRFRLKPDEVLEIVVKDAAAMRERVPDLLDEMTFCIAGINERYEDYGEKPALLLVLR